MLVTIDVPVEEIELIDREADRMGLTRDDCLKIAVGDYFHELKNIQKYREALEQSQSDKSR